MNKDSYKFKDILFGLRSEYLMLEQQLSELKKYILMEKYNIEDVYFHLMSGYEDESVRMLCAIYDRKNKIEEILEKIKIQLGILPDEKVSYVNNVDGMYNIEKCPKIVDSFRKEEFSNSVFNILNSEIGRNIKFIHSGIGYDDKPFLSVHPGYISLYLNGYVSLEFNPHKGDFIHMYGYKGMVTREKIDTILNVDFPKKKFPEYYQNIIENSSSIGKEYDVVGDIEYCKKVDFEIIDESKKLVLRKK